MGRRQVREKRLRTHAALSKKLARLLDDQLATLLQQSPLLHSRTGGSSVLVEMGVSPVFVKKVRFSMDEQRKGRL